MKQCCTLRLEISVGAVPKKTKKAKKARNAKKRLREEILGRPVPGWSTESETGHKNQVIPRRIACQDMYKYVYSFMRDGGSSYGKMGVG